MKLKKSEKAFAKAKALLPGGVDSPVRAFGAVGGTPPFIASAKGGVITDIDGNEYIDYVQSWGPMVLGHGDKKVLKAVIQAAEKGLSFGAPTLAETELAGEILELFPFLDKIRFVNSGTEAVMSALRLARGVTGKHDIIKFKGCYHGHSDSLLVQAGSGAATFGTPSSPGVPPELAKHTLLADYNDLESVKVHFHENHDVACIILEPIAGNMGLVPADEGFLQGLRELCDRHGAILIFDEVMSGFRAGLRGACDHTSVKPDMITFGKVIGGGMPVGAFAGSRRIMDQLSPEGPVYQAGTLSGNPVAMAAGLATLKQIKKDPDFYAKLEQKAARLAGGLSSAAAKAGIPLQTLYRGSMVGFFFSETPVKNFDDALACDGERFAKFHRDMLAKGVYLACSAFETGFISAKTSDKMIDKTVKAAEAVLKEPV